MKWGRKKSNNQVSYSLSSLSHFFPISWLSKFKPTNDESEYPLAKTKRKNKPNSPLLNSTLPVSSRPTRLHRKDPSFSPEVPGRRTGRRTKTLSEVDGGDEFCPLSFGGESFAGKKTRGISRSALYDSDFELEFPLSSCHSCRSATKKKETKEESQKFTNKVPNIRKMRDSPAEVKMRSVTCEGQEFEAPTGKILKDGRVLDRKFRKTSQRVLENSVEKNQRSSKPVESRLDLELETTILTEENGNCSLTSLGSGKSLSIVGKNSPKTHKFTALNSERTDQLFVEESDSEWERAKELKVKELLSKSEKQRKSIYIRREVQNKRAKQSCKVKVNSPRTPSKMEVCKIRALEDRKKAKMKMATKDRTVEGTTGLENYAVTTCSFNPSKDFRDSMVEMISEYQMKGSEELEDLLACYLTLNSDEYHDLIIKVFRQVWFDLNRPCFSPELQKDDCYTDE